MAKQILVADDHTALQRGVQAILLEHFPAMDVSLAGSFPELLAKTNEHRFDLVLLDLWMQGGPGLEMIHNLRRDRPAMPILVYSMYPEAQFGLRTLRAGAMGYLNKGQPVSELVSAIRRCLEGKRYISEGLADVLAVESSRAPGDPLQQLTDRELEVMRAMAAGKSPSDIAEFLSLSPKTVSTYRARILEKLGLHSSAEIIRVALENNLSDLPLTN